MNIFGFINLHSNCYLNAIIQSLLASFPHFHKGVLDNEATYTNKQNELGLSTLALVKDALVQGKLLEACAEHEDNNDDTNDISRLRELLMGHIRQRQNPRLQLSMYSVEIERALRLPRGYQQCVHEVLHKIIDECALEAVFESTYNTYGFCVHCNSDNSDNNDNNDTNETNETNDNERIKRILSSRSDAFMRNPKKEKHSVIDINVTPDNLDTLDEYKILFESVQDETVLFQELININLSIISEYACETCHTPRTKNKYCTISVLKDPSPVLIISLNKFNGKFLMNFPEEIRVGAGQQKYSLVSVIDHSGMNSGGHYTTQTKSAVLDKWFLTNDEFVVPKPKCVSSKDSFLLFYIRT
jgi:uncharacterized UBP type Zn finger protein